MALLISRALILLIVAQVVEFSFLDEGSSYAQHV